MALGRWWPKASLSWWEDDGEGVEAMDNVSERVVGEELAGHRERVVGAGALLGWRQLAAGLQGCGRKEFAYIRADLNGEVGGYRQTLVSEITQRMCNFTPTATLKCDTEIERWMCNFSLCRPLTGHRN